MERLTKPTERAGNRYVSAIGSGKGAWPRIIQRLAAYENTGMEPQIIQAALNGEGCDRCRDQIHTPEPDRDDDEFIISDSTLWLKGRGITINYCPWCGRRIAED